MAGVPVDAKEVYETPDRNYLLFLAAAIDKVIYLRSDAMRKAEKGHG